MYRKRNVGKTPQKEVNLSLGSYNDPQKLAIMNPNELIMTLSEQSYTNTPGAINNNRYDA